LDWSIGGFFKVNGSELRALQITEIVELWEIDGHSLLTKICDNLNLKGSYTLGSTIDELRLEYRFAPSQIKIIADSLVN